jgi:hypothetical protein
MHNEWKWKKARKNKKEELTNSNSSSINRVGKKRTKNFMDFTLEIKQHRQMKIPIVIQLLQRIDVDKKERLRMISGERNFL